MDSLFYILLYTLLGNQIDLALGCLNPGQRQFFSYSSAEFLTADLNKGSQMRQGNGLAAVLARRYLRDDLRCDVASGGEAVRLFNECSSNDRSVLEHILQIHQVAVMNGLGRIIRIVKMNTSLVMCRRDFGGQDKSACQVAIYLTSNIVSLCGNDIGVFIRILLLRIRTTAVQNGKDFVIGRICLSHQLVLIAVYGVILCQTVSAGLRDGIFHHVLYGFYGRNGFHV